MNDIFNVSEFLFTVLYADDTSILVNGSNYSDLVQLLNNELCLLTNWLKANKLSLNVQKTFYMVFHRARMKNKDFDTSIVCMNGMKLERTDCFKYLGVILDSNITWTQHISYIKNKLSNGIGIMYKARQYLDKKALLNIYIILTSIPILFIVLRYGAMHLIVTYILYFSYKRKLFE